VQPGHTLADFGHGKLRHHSSGQDDRHLAANIARPADWRRLSIQACAAATVAKLPADQRIPDPETSTAYASGPSGKIL
jgi:hypothetical protein